MKISVWAFCVGESRTVCNLPFSLPPSMDLNPPGHFQRVTVRCVADDVEADVLTKQGGKSLFLVISFISMSMLYIFFLLPLWVLQ